MMCTLPVKGYHKIKRWDTGDVIHEHGQTFRECLEHGVKNGVDFFRADLMFADLIMFYLKNAKLSESNLFCANIYRTNLENADLKGADLQGANFMSANMECADMTNAWLKSSKIINTKIIKTKGIVIIGSLCKECEIDFAVKHEKTAMIKLNNFWGTTEEACMKIRADYGPDSSYEKLVRLNAKIVMEG